MTIEKCIYGIPKAELHVHIEGTFEPELMFKIAQRNNIKIKYISVKDLRKAYDFNNLQEFLDIYYAGASVLIHEQDFYDITWAYIKKLYSQNVLHAELFFDPQTHTNRGIQFPTVITGIHKALINAEKEFGMSTKLIMCFLRHLDEKQAFQTLEQSLEYKDWIVAVGLDSSEVGHPPSKFQRVFKKALDEGFLTVAHAGEEGPPEYVWEALNLLNITRIDHGNRALEDDSLIEVLRKKQIPLTVCPLSNLKLRVVDKLEKYPLKKMMNKNLLVTINSDDPAYFGGQLNDNYLKLAKALNLTNNDIHQLAKNSFTASFLSDSEKLSYIKQVNDYHK
ncbi:MAG: adenosine deaminase [Candidatus Marinimicrobia bacterium]|nr:adenosine deaminase [Candidatus Neomarinimicrobiota bacterium]